METGEFMDKLELKAFLKKINFLIENTEIPYTEQASHGINLFRHLGYESLDNCGGDTFQLAGMNNHIYGSFGQNISSYKTANLEVQFSYLNPKKATKKCKNDYLRMVSFGWSNKPCVCNKFMSQQITFKAFFQNIVDNLSQKTFSSNIAGKIYPNNKFAPAYMNADYMEHLMSYSVGIYKQFFVAHYKYHNNKNIKPANNKDLSTVISTSHKFKYLIKVFYENTVHNMLQDTLEKYTYITVKDFTYIDMNLNLVPDITMDKIKIKISDDKKQMIIHTDPQSEDDILYTTIQFDKPITMVKKDIIPSLKQAVVNLHNLTQPIKNAYSQMNIVKR